MMKTTKNIGDFGEKIARDYLVQKGYRILDTNFRVKCGEIDIIALQRDILVFVEVKTRKNDWFYSAREAVNSAKQLKLQNAAREYMRDRNLSFRETRFDVIEYYTQTGKLEHYVDAF